MKQTLVEQGMYKEQENSHLGWPDHTDIHNRIGSEGVGIVSITFNVISPKNVPNEYLLNT